MKGLSKAAELALLTIMVTNDRRHYAPNPECFKDSVDRMTDDQIRKEMDLISRKESGLTRRERNKVEWIYSKLDHPPQ